MMEFFLLICQIVYALSADDTTNNPLPSSENGSISQSHEPNLIMTSEPIIRLRVSETFTVNCSASGRPVPTIRWMKNGKAINNSVVSFENVSIATLHIESASLSSSGKYLCEAKNHLSTVRSRPISVVIEGLIVAVPLPPITKVKNGTSHFTLHCDVIHFNENATSKANILWMFNKESHLWEIESNKRYLIHNGTLELFNVTAEFLGNYTCTGQHLNETVSTTTTLVVYEPIEFENQLPSLMKARSDSIVRLQCRVHGWPRPQISWFFTAKGKSEEPLVMEHKEMLLISADKTAQGTYTCQAANLVETRVQSVYLEVRFPPNALSITAQSIHQPDICINVTWKLNGDDKSTVQHVWVTLLNMNELFPGNGSPRQIPVSLSPNKGYVEIHKLEPSTVYQLVMWCSNALGESPITQLFFKTPETKQGNITLQSGPPEEIGLSKGGQANERWVYIVVGALMFMCFSVCVLASGLHWNSGRLLRVCGERTWFARPRARVGPGQYNSTLRGFSNPVFMDPAFVEGFHIQDLSAASEPEQGTIDVGVPSPTNNRH